MKLKSKFSNQPKVSVIVPAYNHEKYVGKTIESIINQTYGNLEFIMIDDGSCDGTWDVISGYKKLCEERISQVIFIRQKNAGTCETLNRLISSASGKYVFFAASDDIISNKAIELFVEFLEQNDDYVLAVGENAIIDENGKRCYWDINRNNVYIPEEAAYKTFTEFLEKINRKRLENFDSEEFGTYKSLFSGNYIPNGFAIRKNVLDEMVPLNKNAPLEDWFLVLQVAKYGRMKFIREITYFYRWHSNNTVKNTEKMNLAVKKTLAYEVLLLRTRYNDLYRLVSENIFLNSRRYLLNWGGLKIYKTRNIEFKMVCIDLFGLRFNINYKKNILF